MRTSIKVILTLCAFVSFLTIGGCVLEPRGMRREQARLKVAGKDLDPPIEQRTIPELPSPASWRDCLARAFLVNGALEASYFEWKAAMTRIPQVATWPNTNLAPSFSYLFSGEKMKSWDRTTVNIGFDPMENLAFPTKVSQAGKIALKNAQAAGEKFRADKFELQRKVLNGCLDLSMMHQKIRIQQENVALLKMLSDTAQSRVQAGGSESDLLRAQTQFRLAENDLATTVSQHSSMEATLNAMLERDPRAGIVLPDNLPSPRPIAASDDRLIAVAVEQNPELAKLSHEVAGRTDAVELARMSFIPDLNPAGAFTGGVSQSIGAMLILPTTIPEIRGKIDEERAMLRANQAMLRQTRADRAASFVAALVVLRNSERQASLFEQTILPRAEQSLASMRQSYATGNGSFTDLIESQRTVLDVKMSIVETRIEREKQIANLEALAGVDIETLATPTTAPATSPETSPATSPTSTQRVNP